MDNEKLRNFINNFSQFAESFDNAIKKIHKDLFPEYRLYTWDVQRDFFKGGDGINKTMKGIKVYFYNNMIWWRDDYDDGIFYIDPKIALDNGVDIYIDRIKNEKELREKKRKEYEENKEKKELKRLKEKYENG